MVAAMFKYLPMVGLATVLFVHIVSAATGDVPLTPFRTISRYAAVMPAAFFWRIATVSGAVLLFQTSLPVWKRSRALAVFMALGAVGCAGLGSVSVLEGNTMHNLFAFLFVGFLVMPQVIFTLKAYQLRDKTVGCCGRLATITAPKDESGASLFRADATVKPWLLLCFVLFTIACGFGLLVVSGLNSQGSLDDASYAEGWAIVEVLVVVSTLLCNSYIGTIIFDVPLMSKEAAAGMSVVAGGGVAGVRVVPAPDDDAPPPAPPTPPGPLPPIRPATDADAVAAVE